MPDSKNSPDEMELFWNTIAEYNRSTWAVQTAIIAVGVILTSLMYRRPTCTVKRAMKCYLILLNVWIAAAYYLHFCHERPYNEATALIWAIMAAIWAYDAATGYTDFERNSRHGLMGGLVMLLPLAYPLISAARGMHFPMMASPVMPSSVALFTIGVMLSFSRRVNLFIVLFLCHWALVGASKIYYYDIPEDALLACAIVPSIYIFLKEYVTSNISPNSKPDPKTANILLITLSAGTGILFATLMARPLIF